MATSINDLVPHVFPVKNTQCRSWRDAVARCFGADRSIHFVEHMFLAYLYLYAKRWGLQDADRIPRGLRFIDELAGGSWEKLKAFINTSAIGFGWEGIETWKYYRGETLRDDDGKQFLTGFPDPNWKYDVPTNYIGYIAANIVDKDFITQGDVDTLVNFMNNNFIYEERESRRQPTHQFARSGVIMEQASLPAAS